MDLFLDSLPILSLFLASLLNNSQDMFLPRDNLSKGNLNNNSFRDSLNSSSSKDSLSKGNLNSNSKDSHSSSRDNLSKDSQNNSNFKDNLHKGNSSLLKDSLNSNSSLFSNRIHRSGKETNNNHKF